MKKILPLFFALFLLQCTPGGDLSQMPATDLSNAEPQVKTKIEGLMQLLRENPDESNNWGRLGINLFVHGFESDALPCLQEANRLDPENFRWAYLSAFAYGEKGDERALDWYQKAQVLDPNYAPLYIKIGRMQLIRDQHDAAQRAFYQALEADPNLSHGYVGLGEIAFEREEIDEAINHLQKAISLNPEHREAYALLVSCYRKNGDLQKARLYAAQMEGLPKVTSLPEPLVNEIAKEGVSAYWYQLRGKQYVDAGLPQAAVKELEAALKIQESAETHNNLGIAYAGLNKPREALRHLRKAAAMKPDKVDFLSNLGAMLFENGNHEEGVAYIRDAFNLDPGFNESTLNLANYYQKKGQWKDAIAVYRKGIIADQNNRFFLYNLAWLLVTVPVKALRDSEEAMGIARFIGTKSDFKDPEAVDLLAAVYAEAGNFKAASDLIKDALKLAEGNDDVLMVNRLKQRESRYAQKRPWRLQADPYFSG